MIKALLAAVIIYTGINYAVANLQLPHSELRNINAQEQLQQLDQDYGR